MQADCNIVKKNRRADASHAVKLTMQCSTNATKYRTINLVLKPIQKGQPALMQAQVAETNTERSASS
jgi:hypothetical protein